MTFEQETKQISDFLRMNCGCFSPSGILTAAADRLDAQSERIAELESTQAWRPVETAPLDHVQIRADSGEGTAQRVFVAMQVLTREGKWAWWTAIGADFLPMHAAWRVTGWKPLAEA